MNTAATIIPQLDALPLPGPVWLFEALLYLTFTLHLLAMNFLLGGAIIALIERVRTNGNAAANSDSPREVARWIEKRLPATFAFTVTLGVAPLLFVQALYGHFLYTGSVVMAWPWFLVIPVLIVAYYLSYALSFKGDRFGVGMRWAGAGLVAGLLFVAFVYVNNMSLALRPESWATKYFERPDGWNHNLGDPTFWPRLLHFVFAAVAVTGMVLATKGARSVNKGDESGRRWLQLGAVWFMVPTALQIATGLWWLIQLPRDVMMPLMGGDAGPTMIFMISITLPIVALVMMAVAMKATRPFGMVHGASWLLILTIVGMVLTRDSVRKNLLAPYFDVGTTPTTPQWGVFALFALLLVIALAAVAWMLAVFMRSKPRSPATL